jgi:hypothetical protein
MALSTPEDLQHFMDVRNRYDYWAAPHEENAAVGRCLLKRYRVRSNETGLSGASDHRVYDTPAVA